MPLLTIALLLPSTFTMQMLVASTGLQRRFPAAYRRNIDLPNRPFVAALRVWVELALLISEAWSKSR